MVSGSPLGFIARMMDPEDPLPYIVLLLVMLYAVGYIAWTHFASVKDRKIEQRLEQLEFDRLSPKEKSKVYMNKAIHAHTRSTRRANLNQALMYDPKNDEADFDLGLSYEADQPSMAIWYLKRAIDLKPSLPVYRMELADVFHNKFKSSGNKEDLEEALANYSEALKLHANKSMTDLFYKKDLIHIWADVHQAESLGIRIDPVFIAQLKREFGRQE